MSSRRGQATTQRAGLRASETRVLLWIAGALFALDIATLGITVRPGLDALRVDMLPVLLFATAAALLSRQGVPAIVSALALAFASLIQAPFMLFEWEACGVAVSNLALAFVIAPFLFASPLHVIPTLAASFVVSQWVLRRLHVLLAALVSVALISIAAAGRWLWVSHAPGTGSCPNF